MIVIIKAVLFDAYGTLFSTGTSSIRAVQAILDKRGVRKNAKNFYAIWKRIHRRHLALGSFPFQTEQELYHWDLRELYSEFDIGTEMEADADVHFMLEIQGTRHVYPETIQTLAKINQKKIIASTNDHAPLLVDIERAGLIFDAVYSSESLKVYKPETMFYEKILESEGLIAEECIFVGDTFIDDVYGPSRVGIRAIWVNRKNVKPLLPQEVISLYTPADVEYKEIRNLEELPEVIRHI